jgi:hypothetical protein
MKVENRKLLAPQLSWTRSEEREPNYPGAKMSLFHERSLPLNV